MRAAHNVAIGKRFDVAHLVEQVGTEKCSVRFLKKDARVPAVRQMRSPAVTKSILSGTKSFAIGQSVRVPTSEVIDANDCADLAANNIRVKGCGQPFV